MNLVLKKPSEMLALLLPVRFISRQKRIDRFPAFPGIRRIPGLHREIFLHGEEFAVVVLLQLAQFEKVHRSDRGFRREQVDHELAFGRFHEHRHRGFLLVSKCLFRPSSVVVGDWISFRLASLFQFIHHSLTQLNINRCCSCCFCTCDRERDIYICPNAHNRSLDRDESIVIA